MTTDEEILISPEISQDFQSFEEFCGENAGRERAYLELVAKNPLDMDAVTLAFTMRHLVRLSRHLMDMLLESFRNESVPELADILAVRGVQLDKTQSALLRDVIFAFRDSHDSEFSATLVRAFQLMTISRERNKVALNLGEAYSPPEEGWTQEDFGGDDSMLETVRAIEDPHWVNAEEI
ncbi:MAG TPA: hypothetical protein VK463_06050 [Desulfomonilaceae bacterium]|nr:hypothetical protein [Desulfomonilaceae bacterium]